MAETKQPYKVKYGFVVVGGAVRHLSTEYQLLAKGTTGQRPVTLEDGMIRYNTSTNTFEGVVNGSFVPFNTGVTTGTVTEDDVFWQQLTFGFKG